MVQIVVAVESRFLSIGVLDLLPDSAKTRAARPSEETSRAQTRQLSWRADNTRGYPKEL
jgi:hypothetical protein